jgi:hypothetical protein
MCCGCTNFLSPYVRRHSRGKGVTGTDGDPDVDAKWIRIKFITSLVIQTDLKVIALRSCLGLDMQGCTATT